MQTIAIATDIFQNDLLSSRDTALLRACTCVFDPPNVVIDRQTSSSISRHPTSPAKNIKKTTAEFIGIDASEVVQS